MQSLTIVVCHSMMCPICLDGIERRREELSFELGIQAFQYFYRLPRLLPRNRVGPECFPSRSTRACGSSHEEEYCHNPAYYREV